jgi:Fe-S-cluster containining protein
MSEGDRERLLQVAQSLARAASERGKKRLPVVAAADAAGLVAMMHDQLDQAIAVREADIADAGIPLACGRGCNACCKLPVMIGDHEAVAVARHLAEPANAAVRDRFLEKYAGWRQALGGLIEAVVDAPSQEERVGACAAYFSRHALCPFNHEGDCTIYEVRPALCRTTHAINTRDRCQDETANAVEIAHPAVEQVYEGQEAMRTMLHASLRPGRPHELLPKAVMRRLTKATAFANRPCPCGSGIKHKSCCGRD